MPNPKRSVSDFVSKTREQRWLGGQKCRTCQLKNRKAVETACAEFSKLRREGTTQMPWSTFVREFLKPDHGYLLNHRSLVSHLEKCLGQEVP